MASKTFNPFASTAKPKVVRTRDALDVAARYFVYKLYDVTRQDSDTVGVSEGNRRDPGNDRTGGGAWLGSPSTSYGQQSAPERGGANRRGAATGAHGAI